MLESRVDILLRRSDLQRASEELAKAGFVYCSVADVSMFLDGPSASPRDAVHVVFAGEKIRPDYALPAPDVSDCEVVRETRTLSLEALVRM
jgi:hypothetical protein